MNDADSTPSPSRFWSTFGILKAALKASAESELPKKCAKMLSRTRPAMRLRKIPAATREALLATVRDGSCGTEARAAAAATPVGDFSLLTVLGLGKVPTVVRVLSS